MTDTGDEQIRTLLSEASDHDQAARASRAQAGRLLADLRLGRHHSDYVRIIRGLGLDVRSAGILMEMGADGRVRATGDRP